MLLSIISTTEKGSSKNFGPGTTESWSEIQGICVIDSHSKDQRLIPMEWQSLSQVRLRRVKLPSGPSVIVYK